MKEDIKFIKCDNCDFCVRKKEILNNEKKKIIAFAVRGIDVGINKDIDFNKIAEEILEKEMGDFEEKIVLYEWECGSFRKVEDIKNQTWFKI
jgi:hypothetical protein